MATDSLSENVCRAFPGGMWRKPEARRSLGGGCPSGAGTGTVGVSRFAVCFSRCSGVVIRVGVVAGAPWRSRGFAASAGERTTDRGPRRAGGFAPM